MKEDHAPGGPRGLELQEKDGGVTLRVRVQPRASREAVAGLRGGALLVRLTAPPVEGAANAALLRLLARALDVAPSCIEILRGARGAEKLLRVRGLGVQSVRERLQTSRK